MQFENIRMMLAEVVRGNMVEPVDILGNELVQQPLLLKPCDCHVRLVCMRMSHRWVSKIRAGPVAVPAVSDRSAKFPTYLFSSPMGPLLVNSW